MAKQPPAGEYMTKIEEDLLIKMLNQLREEQERKMGEEMPFYSRGFYDGVFTTIDRIIMKIKAGKHLDLSD